MPIFRNRAVVDIARGVKAFLNVEAGVVRGAVPSQAGAAGNGSGGVRAGDLVWIFGFGRSGTTWLSAMMGDMKDHVVWAEPMIGALFGSYYYRNSPVAKSHRESPSFILGSRREMWTPLLRSFVLDGAALQFPGFGPGQTMVLKEPHSSIGAPLLMEALPESRMIFMMRDPRDVMASSMDSVGKGNWGAAALNAEKLPEFNLKRWMDQYTKSVEKAKEAYEAHKGPKVLLKYEDLRADPLAAMRRVYSTLGVGVDDGELARVVEKHSWENIPADQKGIGKFYRKGTSGGWAEDLSPEQIAQIEEAAAPLIEEFYGAGR